MRASAARVPMTVAASVTVTARRMLSQRASVSSRLLRKFAYQRKDSPRGGNTTNAAALNETGTTMRMGARR